MVKEKTKNKLILVGIFLPIIAIAVLMIISIMSPPLEPELGPESERVVLPAITGKEFKLFENSFYGINKSPFIIEGDVVMEEVADVYFDLHVKRFERLTTFEIYLNDYYIGEEIDDLQTTEHVKLKLDKIDMREGSNKIKIIIQDFSRGGASYPSFSEYPLRLYSDSKVISEGINSADFEVVSL